MATWKEDPEKKTWTFKYGALVRVVVHRRSGERNYSADLWFGVDTARACTSWILDDVTTITRAKAKALKIVVQELKRVANTIDHIAKLPPSKNPR